MPGFLMHVGASVTCAHGGQAQPTTPNPRVLVSGQPTVTMTAPYMSPSCPFNLGGAPSPCLTDQWVRGATRVFSGGVPLVLLDSQALCTPNGTPLRITATQTRVTGT